MSAWEIWQLLCGLLLVASFGYWSLAWHSLRRWQPHLLEMDDGNAPSVPAWPTVSLLKPLHGADPTLADLVLAAARQNYPDYTLICGVQQATDPALQVLEALQRQHPQLPLRWRLHDCRLGSNPKVNNLAGMSDLGLAPVVVIQDADIAVGPDYLRRVVAALEGPRVGLVTCLYRPRPDRHFWSSVLAAQVQELFLPSVLVANRLGPTIYCAGATMALRRDMLELCGGWRAIADSLADDYALGARVRAHGKEIALSNYMVDTQVMEAGFRAFHRHALRWARTTRSVQPLGHAFSFLSYPLPLTMILAPWLGWGGWILIPVVLTLRLVYHRAIAKLLKNPLPPAAVLLGDLLALWIWAVAWVSRRVYWQGSDYAYDSHGRMRGGDGVQR